MANLFSNLIRPFANLATFKKPPISPVSPGNLAFRSFSPAPNVSTPQGPAFVPPPPVAPQPAPQASFAPSQVIPQVTAQTPQVAPVAPPVAPPAQPPAPQPLAQPPAQPPQQPPIVAPPTQPEELPQPAAVQPPPVSPETQKAVRDAELAVQQAAQISPDELSTQADLERLAEATRKAYTSIQGQAVPMGFITGQLASVERRALGQAQTLEDRLARQQAARTASLEASKFALARADSQAEIERKELERDTDTYINEVGDLILFDTKTGETVRNLGPQARRDEGFTLAEGQVRFDSAGNVIASNVGSEGLSGGFGGFGYVPGESPTVDAWVQNINAKQATLANVPSDLKNAVSNALASGGAITNYARVDALRDKIGVIDSLINHRGMSKAVGPTGIARFTPFKIDTWTGDIQDFVGKVHQLTAQETLDFLIDLKVAGGTLGALNQKELETLQQSATALNDWEIKDENGNGIGKWNITESRFKEELRKMQTLANRALQRAAGGIGTGEQPQELEMLDGTILRLQADGTYE